MVAYLYFVANKLEFKLYNKKVGLKITFEIKYAIESQKVIISQLYKLLVFDFQ